METCFEYTERDITCELYREYDMGVRVYKIDNPVRLILRTGGTTHRVIDRDNITHCVPAPGVNGCVLRWKSRDENNPVQF